MAGTTANQMLMVAVGWQMYDLTSSAWDLGLVGLFQFMPALLLTLLAGHVADRFHRGHIVAATLGLQGVVAALLALGSVEGWISRDWLLGVSVLLGVARAFQMPAQQALTPMLVPPAMLPRALAFSSTGQEAAVIGGPALGGFIYVAGASHVYLTCLGLFVIGSALIYGLHYPRLATSREPLSWGTVLAGVHFIWRRKPLLGAVSLDLFAVLLGGAVALLPIFAKDILHTGPEGLGVLRAAPSVGALLMSLVLTRWTLRRWPGRWLLGAVGVFGLSMIVFGLSTSFWISLGALALSGAADMVNVVLRSSLVQLETPNEMRGRVSAVNSIFIGASNQLGEFESGSAAALLGPVVATVAGGVGTLCIALLWIRLFPSLWHRTRLEAPPES
ncbi:MFS transporter [Comamonadaceae bacterium SL12-8]|uniref:MFS transporter n=1 Tax=Amphibiibacter pelophylacis TaxID=1799477 RepID=A0ACC6P0J0_9BURK